DDHVVFCWAPACGGCPSCLEGRPVLCDRLERTTYRNRLPSGKMALRAHGQDVASFLGTACFADHAVVPEEGAVVVPRDLAFGATDAIEAADTVPDAVRGLTAGRGADYVFDTVGTPATLADAIASARKGGTIVLTGLSRLDAQGSFAMFPFVMQEKRVIGSVYGSGNPVDDIA